MADERDWNRHGVAKAVLVVVMLFLLLPFVVVLGSSLDIPAEYHIDFPPRGITLQNYAAIPVSYWHAGAVSLLVGLVVAALASALGLCAALGLVRSRVPGREVLHAFFRLPVQIPYVVTGAVFLQFYFQLAAWSGLDVLTGPVGLIIAHVFVAVPYSIGAISALLLRFDMSLEEAAESLGATGWTTFWHVTFPAIRPGVMAGLFYAFIVSFGDVPVALFLVTGKWTTLPVQIFQDMQFDFKPSMLAVSSLVAVLSLVTILATQKLAGFEMVEPRRR
jgi:putative spermidine/putrescine transport system permease protein